MPRIIRQLKEQSNTRILNAIRNEASPEYQKRVPAATQGNVRDVLDGVTSNRGVRNEFYDALINRIGGVLVHNMSWSNPLGVFKRGLELNGGNTIEEIKVGLVHSRVYDPNNEYLGQDNFQTYSAPVQSAFHTVDRREYYPITVPYDDAMLRDAFLTSQGGLSQFVAQLMEAPVTSDNLDEYLLTTSLFAEYARLGGYYRVHVDAVDTVKSGADAENAARDLLREIRAYAEMLTLRPSTRYNAAHMPTVSKRDDLVLFCTPQVKAALDVEGLAPIFHLDKANIDVRVITIMPEDFGLSGDADGNNRVQAILTTSDFFVIVDRLLENTSQDNPVALQRNYFLHHWEILSLSRFANAVLFWTGEGTPETLTLPDGVRAAEPQFAVRILPYGAGTELPDHVERGGIVQASAYITAANADDADFTPHGIRYKVEGATSPFTRIDNEGILVVGIDEAANSLKVTAQATYINPATPEVESPVSAALDVPVEGDGVLGFNAGMVVSLKADAATLNVVKGVPQSMPSVAATLTNGRIVDVSNMVAWDVSSGASNVSIDHNTVTGVAVGSATATAHLFGVKSDAVTVAVAAAQ